jgi:uncharacterized membrane protein
MTFRALHDRVAAKYQFFKILTAIVAVKLKNRHVTVFSFYTSKLLGSNEVYFVIIVILIIIPSVTSFKRWISPNNFPTIFTALAGRISPWPLMGVGPKKRQRALPRGQ